MRVKQFSLAIIYGLFLFVEGFAQNEISFVVESGPVVKDETGKLLKMGMLGGLNQPQFYNLDIDNDGIKDLFVFDRSGDKVLSFISDGKGNFTYHPEFDQIYPVLNDWVVFKDFDGDGLEDLWFKNELENSSISLYKNITKSGDPHAMFKIVDLDLRAYNFGEAPLDSSNLYCDRANIPAIEDVDGDGDIDFLTLQKFGSGITLFRNVTAENGLPLSPPVFQEVDVCWGDFQEGGVDNSITLARNQWCFRKLKKHAGGSSLLLIDGDEDGDMDLVLGNAGFRNLVYLTNGKKDFSKALDTMIAFDLKFPSNTVQAKVNTFPATFYQDVNNDGIKDLIVSVNYTDKTSGYFRETGNLMYYENTGKNNKPVFIFKDSTMFTKDLVDYGGHAAPLLWDFDGDGDKDMLIATNGDWGITSDMHDRLVLYENVGSDANPIFQMALDNFLGLEKDSIQRMMPALGDLNRDGKPELLIGQANGSLTLYNIVGTGKKATSILVSKNAFNIDAGSSSAPHLADIDGDGYIDLLVGCYDGNTFHFKNTSTTSVPKFEIVTDTFGGVMANTLVNQLRYDAVKDTFYDTLVYWSYGYSAPFIQDLDGNGDPEFVLGTASGEIKVYRNIRENSGSKFEQLPTINHLSGSSSCYNFDFGANSICAIADLDKDGINDVIIGTSRGGVQYMRGTEVCNTHKVGINNQKRNNLQIYPNPSSGTFSINGLPNGKAVVKIYNIGGSLIFDNALNAQREVRSNITTPGVYVVQVSVGNQIYTGRMIIQ